MRVSTLNNKFRLCCLFFIKLAATCHGYTEGEKRETSTQNLQRNNVSRHVECLGLNQRMLAGTQYWNYVGNWLAFSRLLVRRSKSGRAMSGARVRNNNFSYLICM